MIDWLDNAKEEVANNNHNKSEKFSKIDDVFFKTPIYGIFEDADSDTLHITITKEHHKLMLESLKFQFPDKDFKSYCAPLADEVNMDRIYKKYDNLMSDLEDDD